MNRFLLALLILCPSARGLAEDRIERHSRVGRFFLHPIATWDIADERQVKRHLKTEEDFRAWTAFWCRHVKFYTSTDRVLVTLAWYIYGNDGREQRMIYAPVDALAKVGISGFQPMSSYSHNPFRSFHPINRAGKHGMVLRLCYDGPYDWECLQEKMELLHDLFFVPGVEGAGIDNVRKLLAAYDRVRQIATSKYGWPALKTADEKVQELQHRLEHKAEIAEAGAKSQATAEERFKLQEDWGLRLR